MNLWEEVLARIETKVNRHSFYTWFKPTTFVSADARTLTVRVPNPLFREWLTKHYSGVIAEAIGEVQKADLHVNFVAETIESMTPLSHGTDETSASDTAAFTGPGP